MGFPQRGGDLVEVPQNATFPLRRRRYELPGREEVFVLVDVESEGRVYVWQGGSLGARLNRANFEQLSAEMLAQGLVSENDLIECFALPDDPAFAYVSPLMMAA